MQMFLCLCFLLTAWFCNAINPYQFGVGQMPTKKLKFGLTNKLKLHL